MKSAKFTLRETYFGAVHLIEALAFEDDRGFFYEAWREDAFRDLGIAARFVQDNHSRSRRRVLRGLHWQGPPAAQGKLVRCTAGTIFDVVVDLRSGSTTFGKWASATLSGAEIPRAGSPLLLWVPPGFAHGFLTVSDMAEVQYKVTAPWARDCEGTLRWDDPEVGVRWPAGEAPLLSDKDRAGRSLAEVRSADPFKESR